VVTARSAPRQLTRAALAALALFTAACAGTASSPGAKDEAATKEGATPPDFQLDTLNGDSVRLGDHLGKDVVLIDFWATYCDPCLASMPHLEQIYEKYKSKGLVVLGISIDGPDSIAQVRAEVEKLGVTFPILLDQETRVVALYNPKTSAPYSVLIGRNGHIRAKREGYTTGSSSALEADIVAALSN